MLITVTLGRVNLGATREQPQARLAATLSTVTRNKIRDTRGNIREMIPIFAVYTLMIGALASLSASSSAPAPSGAPVARGAVACLPSGDGYLRATMAGAIDARIDWPNSGTRCEGESREKPPGVRLSFQRGEGSSPDLLLVFGLTGVEEGKPARAVKANLTVIVQGTSRIFSTMGDSRCTVDSLTQRPLTSARSYRLEARGFCTQPAHAVRGKGDELVSTFEFAGPVTFYAEQK